MGYDLQKASVYKRAAAWLFDAILISILAVGIAFLLSVLLGFDGYSDTVSAAYAEYEEAYAISFSMDEAAYTAMTADEQQRYADAYAALLADDEAMHAYSMVVNLTMLITTVSVLVSMLCLAFAVPLAFGNGQTLGKKIFGLGVMRTDFVRLPAVQLLIRTLLGAFTIETMIPIYILLMLILGMMDVTGTVILGALLLAQCIILAVTRTNSLLHDLLAGTVVVELASQKIFGSTDELIEYQKKVHAEQAARQSY
ncbi:MAG: RDD family protein [Clostridia bacterium]|nr:RDD family protein [Clostridia bacterium]